MSTQAETPQIVTPDPWESLQTFTEARIGLGRCGSSLPLAESLRFKLAHAQARDAVHQPVEMEKLAEQLHAHGLTSLALTSSVTDRSEYLTRPDKGRLLSDTSADLLKSQRKLKEFDISIIVCDGLSAPAIHESAIALVYGFADIVTQTNLTVAPVCLVENGRVAIGDQIGSLLKTRLSIVLIGERPGLSSPNSLGVYLTYNPQPGTTDEARNCISNIRPGGMSVADGVRKLSYLVEMGLKQQKTGVELKDNMPGNYLPLESLITDTHV